MIPVGICWKNLDGLILRCVDNVEAKRLMDELHTILCGGHHVSQTTTQKILRELYYWLTIFAYVHKLFIAYLHRKTTLCNLAFATHL